MDYPNLIKQKLNEQSIDSVNIIAMVIAQAAHESASFKMLEESFNYRPETLLRVFPKYFKDINDAKRAIEKGAEHIANTCYGSRMGNSDYASGDGYKYRGRGILQITGKHNYANTSLNLDIDCLVNPDVLLLPENAVNSALFFLKNAPKFYYYAEKANVEQCTIIINGGLNGIVDRKQRFSDALNWLESLK